MKKIVFMFLVIVVMFGFIGCAQVENTFKGFESDMTGLDRSIYISMDDGSTWVYSGNNIRVDSTEYGNKIIVQINKKRLAVYNASVIVEEKGLSPDTIFGPGELAEIK